MVGAWWHSAAVLVGRIFTRQKTPVPPTSVGILAVRQAEYHLIMRLREQPVGSNDGPGIRELYDGDRFTGGAWCGIFVSHCLHHAYSRLHEPLHIPLKHRRGAKALGKYVERELGWRRVTTPKRGDIEICHRGRQIDGRWSWRGHIRFVRTAGISGAFIGLGGNEGHRVRSARHAVSHPKHAYFLRAP